MSNLFDQIEENASEVKNNLLGPSYPYYKNINNPQAIGMSSRGTLRNLTNDVNGLIAYTELLVTGTGKASKTGQPLGNKFFLQSGGKCKDVNTGAKEDRYSYINNVPLGNIPFISSALDQNFTTFRGLIPGAMSNLNSLNPFSLFSGFNQGATPDCQSLTMETINDKNEKNSETQFVTLSDIKNMDPCAFTLNNKVNPITKQACIEAFSNKNKSKLPKDVIIQAFIGSLGILGILLLLKLNNRISK